MKKTVTILAIATFVSTASFAQYDRSHGHYDRDRDVAIENARGGRGTYYFSAREKDMQIASINHEYNRKIESVRHRLFMGHGRKEQKIYSLQVQRDYEIRAVWAKFTDRRNQYNRNNGWPRDRDRKENW